MRRLLLLVLFFTTNLVFAQDNTLVLTSDIWPPFTNVDNQRAIALDIVEMALSRNNIAVKYDIQEFTEVIEGINKGNFDGSAALWINEERKEHLIFSDPYLHNQLILVGKKGAPVDMDDLHLLEGKKVGIIGDYAYGDSLKHKNIEWVYGDSDQQNLDHLLAGQLDYILVESLLIQYLLKTQLADVRAFLSIGHKPMILKTLHFALRKDVSNAEEIITKFNEEIKAMVTDGSYHDILDLDWIHMDVDGDGIPELVLDGDAAGLQAPQNTYNVFYSQPSSSSNRFYVNGQIYEGWENVPSESKLEIPKVAPEYEGKGELKLRLK